MRWAATWALIFWASIGRASTIAGHRLAGVADPQVDQVRGEPAHHRDRRRRPAAIGRRPWRPERSAACSAAAVEAPTTSCSLPRMIVGRNRVARTAAAACPGANPGRIVGRAPSSLRNAIPPPGRRRAGRTSAEEPVGQRHHRIDGPRQRRLVADLGRDASMPPSRLIIAAARLPLAAGPSGRVLHREGQLGAEAGDQVLAEVEAELLADPRPRAMATRSGPSESFAFKQLDDPIVGPGEVDRQHDEAVSRRRVSAAASRRRRWAGPAARATRAAAPGRSRGARSASPRPRSRRRTRGASRRRGPARTDLGRHLAAAR